MAKLSNSEFRQVTDTTEHADVYPSQALMIDGKGYIEDLISGFTTMSVTGRGALAYKFQEDSVPGLDGIYRSSADLPAREIVIKYHMVAKDAAKLIELEEQLKLLFLNKNIRYRFNDDQDYWYIGTLSDHTPVDAGVLDGFGSLTISNPDPYKYHTLQTTDLSSNFTSRLSTVPTEIRITATSDTATGFSLSNQHGQTIILTNSSLTKGQVMKIRPRDQLITVQDVDYSQWLDFSSDLENFYVSPNETLSFKTKTGTATVSIDYEGRA